MGLRENLWKDDVSHVKLRSPLVVFPETTLRQAIEIMQGASTGCVLICDQSALVGIFTERDLVKRILARNVPLDTPLREVMTPRPVTLKQTDSVGWAIRTMYQGHYRHLPVVDEHGQPVGILSVKGVIQYLVDHVPLTVYNLPPEPQQVAETREGA